MPRVAAAVAVVAVLVTSAPAQAHSGNPNFLSRVDGTPAGVSVEVVNRDDRLLLRNESGEEIIIEGYDAEPYARIDGDGEVFVNTRSPAYYLNDDRFADVEVPDGVDGTGPPQWERVDGTGRFEWHDHRMHWMARSTPPQVTDPGVRTEIFSWTVPTSRGPIEGTLFWTPSPGAPVAFIAIGSAVVLGGCAAALFARRRRDRARAPEAW